MAANDIHVAYGRVGKNLLLHDESIVERRLERAITVRYQQHA